ncbi:hypothetical protein AB0H83_45895 [Dactylosporangium sp. NPDC050688]|uniref:hypothetical protein n=1 Tax=Dactylosporangium sp. NPDC050688 TaxID=3157217 RepID=UPI0033F25DB5
MSVTFTTHEGPEVNLANGNAADILALLGLPAEPYGEATAEDFLGRVLIATAMLDASTADADGRPEIIDGRWVQFERRPGYLAEKLALLHEVATWAHQHGTDVWWS